MGERKPRLPLGYLWGLTRKAGCDRRSAGGSVWAAVRLKGMGLRVRVPGLPSSSHSIAFDCITLVFFA